MTALTWDATGGRFYESGVDRGVLGLADGSAVAWTGLISVEDAPSAESKSVYLDGVKIAENVTPGDYVGKLKAYTYPDEFEQFDGKTSLEGSVGLIFHEQTRKKFNLSYRTKVGSDEDSNAGYKIHFLYNLLADPDSSTYATETDSSAEPVEFSWNLTGVPVAVSEIRPMVHMEVDSRRIDPTILQAIEDILYGTGEDEPAFPSVDDILALFTP